MRFEGRLRLRREQSNVAANRRFVGATFCQRGISSTSYPSGSLNLTLRATYINSKGHPRLSYFNLKSHLTLRVNKLTFKGHLTYPKVNNLTLRVT
jgi:hypothetical protein